MVFFGKTALVTGGGKNIGKAVCLALAQQGANVIVCDYNRENAEQTALEVEKLGVGSMAAVCDVRDRKAVFDYANQGMEKFGKIDILVNNAGGSADLLGKLTKFADAEEDVIDFVLDVNLKGTINCIQSVLKSMISNRYGRIINIASIAGVCGIINRVDYSAAKGGVIALTKALALEVGQYNVCVNTISPGAIERDGCRLHHMTFIGEEGRTGTPQDVAALVSFLASQEFITGQNYIIDGGRTLGPKSC